jgi:uncharacterized 2Fe-2S/4Fe-4S cluster protein (DUF4445 family)
MLPDLPLERFQQVGNAAGTGARLALISHAMRAQARKIASRDQYIELACIPNFNRKFAEASLMPLSSFSRKNAILNAISQSTLKDRS